nr:hypothetical protein [Tanacetum cinerariifolium]
MFSPSMVTYTSIYIISKPWRLRNNLQTQTSNTLHNAIMEAGSKDRPPMLAPDIEVPVSEGSLITTTARIHETYKNVSQEIRDQLNVEAKAVQIILTGIDNDIYSTVNACPNACEMWKAIERLKHGESINVQDLETNLYWEFGKFTSQDGESLESYYSRFYKMMNEIIRNQCNVTNHQVNVQFLLQLQLEWQSICEVIGSDGYVFPVLCVLEWMGMPTQVCVRSCPNFSAPVGRPFSNNLQTQTSNTLHNAIMEAGSKDRPPMLTPGSEGSPITTTARIRETNKNVSQDIRDQLNAEAEAVQIILTGIDNDIYSTVDACPNACEMWKAIERSQQAATRNRGKAIANSLQPIYDQEPSMVAEDEETSKDKEIDKLMALISLSSAGYENQRNGNVAGARENVGSSVDNSLRINRSAGYKNQRNGNVAGARENVGSSVVQKFGIQCYNYKEFGHVARECQKPKWAKDAAYHRENMLLCKQEEAGIQLNAEQADWRDDTDDDELEDQELEAHYMYMAQLQEVSPDAVDSGPIFDDEPLQKVSNDDHYNVFAMESTHYEQSKSVHDTYPIEQDAQNVIIDSLDMNYDREEIDQNDDDNDLAKERGLLASLIEKLKCKIDESKNRNKFLETSNKALIEKLKDDWRDDTDDESDDQELEAHYMYMAKLQQVSPDVDDSGPIFDKEPKQKVQNDDHYDVFAIA